MVNMSKISVNGEPIDVVKRNYIFNKGIFNIQPTKNMYRLVGDELVGVSGNDLEVPYQYVNHRIFVEFRIIDKGTGPNSFNVSNGTNSDNLYLYYFNTGIVNTTILHISGLISDKLIKLTCSGVSVNIKSIWTEEVLT